jgi:polysaccharide export outer membrane protein
MQSKRGGASAARIAVAVAALWLAPAPASAEYRLAIGDVLEISAAGLPELRHRAPIDPDGNITLPMGGQLKVKDLLLSEVQAKVRDILPSREFRRRNELGREYPVILAPGEVNVSIAEYRPVYLSGDVAKPGEQAYRPGLTVRQAIALAGGYDIMRFRMNNPFLEQADLRSEYNALWAEFAREQARQARLQAELDGKSEIDRRTLQKLPLPSSVASAIASAEQDQFEARNADYAKEKKYLTEATSSEDGRIAILSERNQKEMEGSDADIEELKRLQELFAKGNVPITRVVDARRALLLSSTRQLQTASELATVERQRQEFGRRSERLDDTRRIEILRDLQDVNVKIATLRAKLEAAGEKLVYVGMVRSQLVRGEGARKPEIMLYRSGDKGRERRTVDEDAELSPGDVVEVALQADLIPGLPAR